MKTSEYSTQTTSSQLIRLVWPLAVSLILILTFTLRLRSAAAAANAAAVRYVAPGGSCGSASPCYSDIQSAVDASVDGGEVRVAAGTYTGAQTKVSATSSYTYTQVVMVDGKNLTLKGGYTTSDWNIADPLSNPTIIDAQDYGRGLTIVGSGTQTVTVSGFQIINGDYTNLGNPTGVSNAACPTTSGDCAGGLLAYQVKLILQDTLIRNNTASRIRPYSLSGGALLWKTSDGTLIENGQIFSNTNTVEGYGGGLVAFYTTGGLTIRNTQFDQNHSAFNGGGLLLTSVSGPVLIQNSRFVGNSAVGRWDAEGGAISAGMLDNMLLDRVEFRDNKASADGAAVSIQQVGSQTPTLWMFNVLAAGNQLQNPQTYGAAIKIVGGTAGGLAVKIAHGTIAANQTPAGIGIAQYDNRGYSFTTAITNTLFTDATYGVTGGHYTATLTINQTNSLFYNVTNQTAVEAGAPTFNTTGTVTGDPKLDANQRLQAGSAAIDAGVNSGVSLDLDGGARPGGSGYDIGADEYSASAPGSFRFSQATYATPEGNGVTITVQRINGTAGAVSVQYATSNGTAVSGSDYTATSGTLNFADGDTSKTFNVTSLQDSAAEADETIVLTLSNPGGGAALGSPNQAVITIQDDDVTPAGKLQFSQSNFTVLENMGAAVVTVQRVNGSSGAVTVDYVTSSGTASPGSDYQETSGTLNFADGETSKTFTVIILNDAVNESNETVNLALTNAAGGAALGAPNQATLTITDNYIYVYLPVVIKN